MSMSMLMPMSILKPQIIIFITCILSRNPVRSGAVTRFELNKAIPFLERKGYRKAIQEMELVLQVPSNITLYTK